MKKIILILITLFLFINPIYCSEEVIAGLDEEKDLPIVNENFRRLRASVNKNVTDIGNLTSSVIVQVVNVQDGAVDTGTIVLPIDDSIPEKTEGDEYMALAITPTSATNKLKIEITCVLAHTASNTQFVVALFQDTTTNALAAVGHFTGGTVSQPQTITFVHYMAAGTTSETTFKVRAGCNSSGTTTFNGTSGVRILGGVTASSITITEIIP